MNEEARAREKIFLWLDRMDRTKAEIARKLKDAGFSEEAAEAALSYAVEKHYIDDERYARRWVELKGGRHSAARIRTDLMRKGVSGDIIDMALEEAEDTFDSEELADRMLRKKMSGIDITDRADREKLIARMSRAGFRINDILKAIDRLELP